MVLLTHHVTAPGALWVHKHAPAREGGERCVTNLYIVHHIQLPWHQDCADMTINMPLQAVGAPAKAQLFVFCWGGGSHCVTDSSWRCITSAAVVKAGLIGWSEIKRVR